MTTKKDFNIKLFLILAILALVLLLSARHYLRLDITEDSRYTLSDVTKSILIDLNEPVTITAYFSSNLPPVLKNVQRDFKDMLEEYESASKGNVAYEFLDPLKDEDAKARAAQEGVSEYGIQVREDDKLTQQYAYMGAIIQYGEQSEVLPLIQTMSGLEYQMTTAIKKMSVVEKPAIGFLQGHGEASIQDMQQAVFDLGTMYEVMPVNLTDTTQELDKFNAVAIIAPTDTIPQKHINQLDAFVKKGGKLLIALNRATANLNQTPYSSSIYTGLDKWLDKYGINVQDNLVLDINCQRISYGVPRGAFTEIRQAMFPYVFGVSTFSEHEIANGLEMVMLQYASSVDYTGDSSLNFKPLLFSSEHSTTEPASTYFNIERNWTENDFGVQNLVIGGAIEGSFNGGTNTRMVVIGDGDFAISTNPQQKVNADNISLLVNSIDWLADDTGLIALRTKGATARPIDELESGKRTFLKYLNFLLPVLLIILYGVFRFQQNRIVRLKRREVGYV